MDFNAFLSQMDFFSAHHQFQIYERTTRFSTKLGKSYSAALMIITLSFAAWKLHQWRTISIQPTITQYYANGNHKNIRLQELNFTLTNINPYYEIDPRIQINSSMELAFVPFLKIYDLKTQVITIPFSPKCRITSRLNYHFCIQEKYLSAEIIDVEQIRSSVFLQKCNETILRMYSEYDGYSCVKNQYLLDLYLNLTSFTLYFDLQYYNFLEGKLIDINQQVDISIQSDKLYLNAISLQIQKLQTNTGYLPGMISNEKELASGYTLTQLNLPNSYIPKLKGDYFGIIAIGYQKNIQYVSIQYVELLDLLSLIFSLAKVFMTFGSTVIKPRTLRFLNNKLEREFYQRQYDLKFDPENNFRPNNLVEIVDQIAKLTQLVNHIKKNEYVERGFKDKQRFESKQFYESIFFQ